MKSSKIDRKWTKRVTSEERMKKLSELKEKEENYFIHIDSMSNTQIQKTAYNLYRSNTSDLKPMWFKEFLENEKKRIDNSIRKSDIIKFNS